VLRYLLAEQPDPKLILSPDPDRPLGTPAGKEKWLTQALIHLFPVIIDILVIVDWKAALV